MNWEKIILFIMTLFLLALGIGFYVLNHDLFFELTMNGRFVEIRLSNIIMCFTLALFSFVMGYKSKSKKSNDPE